MSSYPSNQPRFKAGLSSTASSSSTASASSSSFLRNFMKALLLKPFPPAVRAFVFVGLPSFWAYQAYVEYVESKSAVEYFNPDDVEQWNRAVKAQWQMQANDPYKELRQQESQKQGKLRE